MRYYFFLIFFCAACLAGCGQPLPPADFTFISSSEHNQLDPQRMSWAHDIRIANALYEGLVHLDYSDMSVHPGVAKSWNVSPDQLTYTFHLRDDAKWSNGDPVTAEDFIFAWRRAMLPDLAADYSQLLFHIKGAHAFYEQRAEHLKQFAAIENTKHKARGSGGMTDHGTDTDASAGSPGVKASLDAAQGMWQLTLDDFQKNVGVKAPDEHTLVVTLDHPTPYFLDLLAFPTFMPVHASDFTSDMRFDPATGMLQTDASYWSDPQRLITNGPYVLKARAFRQGLHLIANPYYWNRKALANHSINELIVANPQTALQVYQSGKAQAWLDVPSASNLAADLVSQKRDDVIKQPIAGTYFYDFNCQPKLSDGSKNPLADVRVRRALSMAINRKTLVGTVTRLNQPIARTFVPVGVMKGYDPPVSAGVTFDPDQARKLLADAGYPGGKGLTGLSILYNTGAGHQYIAQAVQAMWKHNLGVVVTLQGVETKVLSERLKRQDYTIARASWIGDYPDPITFLDKMKTTAGNNDCKWSNAQYDALLEKAGTQAGQARMKTLEQAEAILLREQPMALIFQYVSIYLVSPRVTGLKANAWMRWNLMDAAVSP